MYLKTVLVSILCFLCGTLFAQEKDSQSKGHMTLEMEPRFPGEPGALNEFIANNLSYPKKAKKRRVEGKVIVKFVITEDGTIGEVTIIKGIDPDCDEEAIRMIKSMPKWVPGESVKMENGKMVTRKIKSFYTLPVNFRLLDDKSNKTVNSISRPANIYGNNREKDTVYSDAKFLYEKMGSKNKDTAHSAFIMLTEINPRIVSEVLVNDNHNQSTQYFVRHLNDRFLVPLAELTQYCREQHIDYKGSATLQSLLDSLWNAKISYASAYEIENYLIKSLTPEEITAVEYCAMINEDNWRAGYSAGRILNKFYSQKWPLIISNKQQLSSFLKKARIYRRISIVGSLNLYLTKFNGFSEATRSMLHNLEKETEDEDIKKNIQAVLSKSYMDEIEERKWQWGERRKKFQAGRRSSNWPDNLDVLPVITNFKDSMETISQLSISESDKEDKVYDLAELASYNQLGTALLSLRDVKGTHSWDNIRFIRDFFGVPIDYCGIVSNIADSFLSAYNHMDEINLYQHYLDKADIQIKNEHGALDYKKIYDILKFDYSMPFTGMNKRDFGVFAVVKMLETNFNTRLGMPERNQHRNGPFVRTFIDERRTLWMAYLKDHGLIPIDTEPPSFSDYDVY